LPPYISKGIVFADRVTLNELNNISDSDMEILAKVVDLIIDAATSEISMTVRKRSD
jgi:hypothetical protein